MKIIHTADWHIGQMFYNYNREKEHEHFFLWLINMLKEKEVDVLLVAGDIFDVANPTSSAVQQYNKFIADVKQQIPYLQMVVIAGNHDSAYRLESFNPLLYYFNVSHIALIHKINGQQIDYEKLIVPLKDKNNKIKAICLAIPFVQSDKVKELFKELYNFATEKYSNKYPLIAMGHFYATGAEISEKQHSERVVIGGIDCVDMSNFDISNNIIYTALGHIHKAQKVSKKDNLRYAGSPLPMSFAEIKYKHLVNLITIENDNLSIQEVYYEPLIKLKSIPKTYKPFQEVLEELRNYNNDEESYLEVKMKKDIFIDNIRQQIEEAINGRNLHFCKTSVEELNDNLEDYTENMMSIEKFKELKPIDILKNYYKKKFNKELTENLEKLFNEVVSEINNDREE